MPFTPPADNAVNFEGGLWTPPADNAVDFEGEDIWPDAFSNSGYQAASSSYSFNHTVLSTGNNRYLIVGVEMLSVAESVSSITYNGDALSLLGSEEAASGCRVELWGMIAPDTGTNSIAVTLSGSIASSSTAISFINVDQTSPTEGFASASAINVGAADATVDVTTTTNRAWVVDAVCTTDTAITVGAGQLAGANVTGAGGSGAMSREGPKITAGTVTMSWGAVGAAQTWAIAAIALRPVQVAAGAASIGSVFGSIVFGGTPKNIFNRAA